VVTTVLSANLLTPLGVLSRDEPSGARVIVPFEADFTGANNTTIVDLTLQQVGHTFTNPRTLFFDNTDNPTPIIVTVGQTEQEFPIPPNAAGYFPLAAQNNSRITMTSVGGATGIGQGQLYNYAVPPQVWYANGVPVVIAGSTPVIIENTPANPVPVVLENTPVPVTPTGNTAITSADGAQVTIGARADAAAAAPISGSWSVVSVLKGIWTILTNSLQINTRPTTYTAFTGGYIIATGGTALVIFPNGPFQGVILQNPLTPAAQGIATAEPLYYNLANSTPGSTDATAFGSNFALQPGERIVLPPVAANIGLRVNAATTGHRFSGIVW
jgi:hypothetical protein